MNDLEQVLAMFARAGIVFERGDGDKGTVLNCEAHAGPANEGYSGFTACLGFDVQGNLTSIGAWE
jgi:hypothetical protein